MTNDPKKVLLAHGGGGLLTSRLIQDHVLPALENDTLAALGDSAHLELDSSRICFTTDGYVVKPLFFPGGDIGKLAVCGTVNDLAVAGSRPVALALSLIIEEGLEFDVLDRILRSIGETARENNVSVVTGDTKTVERGSADAIFITTTGVGVKLMEANLGFDRIEIGDKVLINGTIGDHGMTIISQREGISFDSPLESDCAGLAGLTGALFEKVSGIKFMRDATRGGLAAVLSETAEGSGKSVSISETAIPVGPAVQAAADMLGFDVLNIANEGKFVAVVSADRAEECLSICRDHPLGTDAAIIGEIVPTQDAPLVKLTTRIGGTRIVQTPYGRELPRIC